MGQRYSHLSSEERILIEKLHCEQHPGIRRTAEMCFSKLASAL